MVVLVLMLQRGRLRTGCDRIVIVVIVVAVVIRPISHLQRLVVREGCHVVVEEVIAFCVRVPPMPGRCWSDAAAAAGEFEVIGGVLGKRWGSCWGEIGLGCWSGGAGMGMRMGGGGGGGGGGGAQGLYEGDMEDFEAGHVRFVGGGGRGFGWVAAHCGEVVVWGVREWGEDGYTWYGKSPSLSYREWLMGYPGDNSGILKEQCG